MNKEKQEIEAKALTVVGQANSLTVTNAQEYEVCGTFLRQIKTAKGIIDEKLGPAKEKTYGAYKEIMSLMKELETPFNQAETTVKRKMSDWYEMNEKERRAEEARLAAEALKREEESRLKQAEALEKAGMPTEADMVMDAPIVIPPPQVAVPKAQGVSVRKDWDFEILQPLAIPRQYLVADEQAIRKVVKALGDRASIPGIRVFQKIVMVSGK